MYLYTISLQIKLRYYLSKISKSMFLENILETCVHRVGLGSSSSWFTELGRNYKVPLDFGSFLILILILFQFTSV